MASIPYSELNVQDKDNANANYKVGFFGIKNGEEAIVRFAIDSINDFELYTVHPITVGQSSYPNRRVSCLRTNPKTDPLEMCPLCAKGEKVQQRMYIKMLQYINENGQIVPKAVVWDRPAYSYAPQIKSYLDNYGPLSNIVCKIIRHGDGLETKYDIIPNLNPQIFNEQLYPKNFSDFADFHALGSIVMNKNAQEINQFIATGSFPQVSNSNVSAQVTPQNAEPNIPGYNPQYSVDTFAPVDPSYGYSNVPPMQSAPNTPVDSVPVMNRPTRYY